MNRPFIPQQNNATLLPAIQKEGCLFLCYLHIASKIAGHIWTPEQVNYAYYALNVNKWMMPNCRILAPDEILLSLSVPILRWVRHERYDYQIKPNELEILKYQVKNPGHTHYVLPDWDPLGESKTRLNGAMIEKIIIRLREES
jgi:hypothetical protein